MTVFEGLTSAELPAASTPRLRRLTAVELAGWFGA